MNFMTFHRLGIIIPTDYFSEGLKPPTRWEYHLVVPENGGFTSKIWPFSEG